MTTTPSQSSIHNNSDLQKRNQDKNQLQSLNLQEHCPNLQIDQSKRSPITRVLSFSLQFNEYAINIPLNLLLNNCQQFVLQSLREREQQRHLMKDRFKRKSPPPKMRHTNSLEKASASQTQQNMMQIKRIKYLITGESLRKNLGLISRSQQEIQIKQQHPLSLLKTQDWMPSSDLLSDQSGVCRYRPSLIKSNFLEQVNIWEQYMYAQYITERNTVISMIQKSIIKKMILSCQFPADSFRKETWLIATGANKLIKNNSGYYQQLLNNYPDFVFFRVIHLQQDISRTFQNEKFFRDKQNIKSLKRVLVAYARRNPQIGYCQGFNFIAARLLKIFSQQVRQQNFTYYQQTFWIFTSILQTYSPPNYYSDMTGLCIDAQIFSILLKERFKTLYDKMTSLDVQITSASWQWFACIFSYNLQQQVRKINSQFNFLQDLLKLWDLYFLQGPTMLFRLSLCIIAVLQKDLLALNDPGQIQMILSRLPVTAMKKKNQFFRNLEKNPKCNYFSKERLQRMREIIERKKFQLQEGKKKQTNLNHGLIFKSSIVRKLVKPKMTDFQSVTNFWSTIAVDDQDFISDHDNDSQNSPSNLSLSYAQPSQFPHQSFSTSEFKTFSPQSPQLSSCNFLKNKIQENPGCFPPWPICTHFLSTPMELSQIAYRVSSQSFHINQNYFYQSENDLSRHSSRGSRGGIQKHKRHQKTQKLQNLNPQVPCSQSISQISFSKTSSSSIKQQCQPKNQAKFINQQRKKRAVHILLKAIELPKEEDFIGREYQNLLIMRQSHQCSSCC